MNFQPIIIGRGLSGQAIERALKVVESRPESKWTFEKARYSERGATLRDTLNGISNPLVFIANPHGLHASVIKQADELKLPIVFCEKPVAVNPDDRDLMAGVKIPVGVFHGYRVMWGPQTIKRLVDDKSFGEIIGIECRYWQSSAAVRAYESAISGVKTTRASWKNDPKLGGNADVFIDLATHWLDLVLFFANQNPKMVRGVKSFINTEAPHRDTHVYLNLEFADKSYAAGSISKTIHGAGNELEISILGSRISAHWNFQNPDQIIVGQNRDKTTLSRASSEIGSGQPGFHGLGWLEGYVEIIQRGLHSLSDSKVNDFPNLQSSLNCFDILNSVVWAG